MKIIVTDPHLRALTELDPDAVIDPQTIEDWDSGEHTLSLGYPLTGPTAARRVPLTLGDIWNLTLEEVETYDPDAI
ncbi:MAG: hypothetical protein FH749_06765 [Firmicutes bacterium]|nr:hypothetical protein [Bacillota bacterium]